MALKFPPIQGLTVPTVNRLFIFVLFGIASSSIHAQPWKDFYDSAHAIWEKDWNKTVSLLKRAEKNAATELRTHDEKYISIINDLGVASWRLKDYQNAEKFFTEAIKLKTEFYKAESHAPFSETLLQLAAVYSDQKNFTQAKIFYKKILNDSAAIPSNVFITSAQNLIDVYEKLDQIDSALVWWRHLDAIYKDRSSHDTRLQSIWMLTSARMSRKAKNYDDATQVLQTLKSTLSRHKSLMQSDLYVVTLHELGMVHIESGSVSLAEGELQEAYRLAQMKYSEQPFLTTNILKDLARFYESMQAHDKALWCYQQLLKLCEKSAGSTGSCVDLKISVANTLVQQAKFSVAIPIFENILDTYKKSISESDPLFIATLNHLAEVYREIHQHHKAYIFLRWAAELIEQYNSNDILAAHVFTNLGLIYNDKNDLDNAAAYYEKAYRILSKIYGDNSITLKKLTKNLAITYWALNKPEKAIPYGKQTIRMWLKECAYTFPILNEADQTRFYETFKSDVEKFSAMASDWIPDHPDLTVDVFNASTWLRHLKFFTGHQRDYLVLQQKDSSLLLQYEQLKAKYTYLIALYQQPLASVTTQSISPEQIEEEIEMLENTISEKTNGRFLRITPLHYNAWETVHHKLKNDEAVIHMLRFRKLGRYNPKTIFEAADFHFIDSIQYAALVTTKDYHSPQLISFKNGQGMETRFFKYYKNALTFNVSDQYSYETYWRPFDNLIFNKRKIFFIPDGVYHSINVNVLHDTHTNQFVLERYTVHRLFHAGIFTEHKAQPVVMKEAVLLGGAPHYYIGASHEPNADITPSMKLRDDGSENEIDKVEKVLNYHTWQTSMYSKNAASERNLKTLKAPGILHLSVPTFASKEHRSAESVAGSTLSGQSKTTSDGPGLAETKNDFLIRNGLIFSEASKSIRSNDFLLSNNGWLSAYEIVTLNLKGTELVIIPFSEHLPEKMTTQEETYVLPQCFMLAGAENVLASFWKTPEANNQQMLLRFYEYLMRGHKKTTALKLAQLDGIKTVQNPMLWGNFVMSGVD